MSFINDYHEEIDTEETGRVISGDLSRVITVYVRALRTFVADQIKINVHKGDPVFVVRLNDGVVVAYDPRNEYGGQSPTGIMGIALEEPQYQDDTTNISKPFPVMIAGEVIATVFAGQILELQGDEAGRYYTGEYISADGMTSTMTEWYVGSRLLLGQIITPKTDTKPIARLYKRPGDDVKIFYHMPIRLMLGPVIPAHGAADTRATIDAYNDEPTFVEKNTPVAVTRISTGQGIEWHFKKATDGAYGNGLTLEQISGKYLQGHGQILVGGIITYTYAEVYQTIVSSPRARLTPFGAKIVVAGTQKFGKVTANDVFDGYYIGQRVTADLVPIETGVPGNQYGEIASIDRESGTITLKLDAVATHAPASVTEASIETEAINDETPAGVALIENPITHRLTPCRFDTDNVDGVLMPAVQLPTVYGWTLQDYRFHFGNTVFMAPDGSFWSALKSFAKGVYKRVIKPVAKWAISIAAPVAASYVSPLGNVLASHVATKCGQLLESVGGTPPNNMVTSVFGHQIRNDEYVEAFTDNSAGYANTPPNATYVYDIDAPTKNDMWEIGHCLRVDPDTGKAVKVSSYDTPIEAVVNFEPAQDPETNGWKIVGIARGHHEIRSSTLKVGSPVLYDGTDAKARIAQKLATAIIGYVREVWLPSQQTLAAVKAGKLPNDEALPNCIVEVKPEYFEADSGESQKTYVTARNSDTEEIPANTSVVLTHNPDYGTGTDEPRWVITIASKSTGDFANGIVKTAIEAGEIGEVLVTGEVTYTWTEVARIVAGAAKKGLFNSRIAKAMAVAATNEGDYDLNDYFVGQRVTDDLLPILDGVPDNQFGTITTINPGENSTPSITVKLDAVATNPPAYEAIADVEEPEDLPVGTSLVENPITHKLVPCRYDTDNVDATAFESIELPQINGWGLEQYQKLYGDGVYEWNGSFWRAIKKFGKGIYKKVIKPAAKWVISLAAPIAGSYVTALGNVIQTQTATVCDQLLNAVTPVNPAENRKYTVKTVHGKTIVTDEPMEQAYVSCSGSFADTHQNIQQVWPIGVANDTNDWAIGDCIAVDNSGNASKIIDYEERIAAICNWLPAQDPATNGWKITGITSGRFEIRSADLKVGDRVLYDGTRAENRIASGQATGVMGKVVEVWKPSQVTLDAIKAGKLPNDEALPNCIVKVSPEYYPEAGSEEPLTETRYYDDPEAELNIEGNKQ